MKKMGCIQQKNLAASLLVFVAALMLASCGDDSPSSTSPTHTGNKGEVSFEISNDGGTGSGTGTSPAEVSKGDTLNMVIMQTSSYTDSDGTVFECEPQATISLFAKHDTVYADDLTQLTNVPVQPEVETFKEGDSPVVNGIRQKFHIGGQCVNFDLAYEVYTCITSEGQTVEMPYVKLNEANLGSSNATEERRSCTAGFLQSVTLKALPQTRSGVSDTTWFEVNAIFSLEIECMNSKQVNKQPLTFSVTYLGGVTREIALHDPVRELSSTISVLGGTVNTSSPFLVTPGEELGLSFSQNSSYTDTYGNKMSCSPEAKIKLFAQSDTIYVKEKESLEGIPESQDFVFTPDGEAPVLYSSVQLFSLGSQHIHLEMSYEVYTCLDIENKEIVMPYLKQHATMPGHATVEELSTVTGFEADTTFYDVRVPISLETVHVGTDDDEFQTIEMVVSYIGAVVTMKEAPELVRVEYRTGYVWEEAHHNLPLLYYAHVFRDRYYSNGEVLTDTFVDAGHMVGLSAISSPANISGSLEEGAEINIQFIAENLNDSVTARFYNMQVTSLDQISTNPGDDVAYSVAGDWGKYYKSKLYGDNAFISAAEAPSNGNWESTDLPTGWYFKDIRGYRRYNFNYQGPEIMWDGCVRYEIALVVYDQFLAIDGRLIDFLKYRPEYHYSFSEQRTSGGLEHKYECRFEFMGRNFYAAVITNISEIGK